VSRWRDASERDGRKEEIAPDVQKVSAVMPSAATTSLSTLLTTARLALPCRQRAMLGEPLLAHPAEIGGVHAT
jgi:hypothetical protein